jgi:peptidyl-prolyl cis-trans isomerase C
VETKYGFHVVRLDNRAEGRQLPFELVHERISQFLTEAVERRAIAQYVAILVGRAKITGVKLQGSSSRLLKNALLLSL